MSLYNMLMGRNPLGPYLMAALGFVKGAPQNEWLGRFRDVYTNDAADRIFILHRNYPEEGEENQFNESIKAHPNYVKYEPSVRDRTYGTWEFTVPEEAKEVVKQIAEMSDNTPLMEQYWKLISDMEKGVKNEATENAMEAGKKLMAPLMDILEGKEGSEQTVVKHGDGSVVVARLTPENLGEEGCILKEE